MKAKNPEKLLVSCPDVMFNIHEREIRDEEYVDFANKHNIHKLVEASGRVRWYGCRNAHSYTLKKSCRKVKGRSLSPASMENLADAVKCIMRSCEEAGAFCELAHGTALGKHSIRKIASKCSVSCCSFTFMFYVTYLCISVI